MAAEAESIRIARDRLARGEHELKQKQQTVKRRESYERGEQKLPFAPKGVNVEYQELQTQSVANFLGIAMGAPVQRMRADSIKTNLGEEADKKIWAGAWQANKMDTRQALIYKSMMLHGRGLASVWPNKLKPTQPIVRPESYELVHIEMDPDDPFTPLYAVKIYQVEESVPTALWLPGTVTRTKTVGFVYDASSVVRFEKGGMAGTGDWTVELTGDHPMRRVPFALYDYRPDSRGRPWSALDQLIPQQDALNTIRFNTLLAMQFAAYRQRIVTGFDPRVLDDEGNVKYKTNNEGVPLLDDSGQPIPILNSPGKAGVDRLLVFPGEGTKVFDLAESNLKNYIEVYDKFLTTFFSTGQIPPQYLLSQMANLSGDALAGAESTLASLVVELQLAAGEGNEELSEMAWYAMGETREFEPTSETQWADAEARSFNQIADAITKLISVDFPHRDAFEMLPGATKTKVDRWMEHMEDESFSRRLDRAARPFTDATDIPPVTDQTEIARDPAPVGG
jgi:hypothetical protein